MTSHPEEETLAANLERSVSRSGMNYEEAIALWGAARLDARKKQEIEWLCDATWLTEKERESRAKEYSSPTDPKNVHVHFEFDDGYACCGGRDPECYCSQATAPVAEVQIVENDGMGFGGTYHRMSIPIEEFDFFTVLREIIQTAGGTITAPPPPEPKVTKPAPGKRQVAPIGEDEIW